MKGKKSNIEFVSSFMNECIKNGISSSEDIVKEASKRIEEMEIKIQEAEKMKIIRSNLIDVIDSFSNKKIYNTSNEIIYLDLFSLQLPEICQKIVAIVAEKPQKISDFLENSNFEKENLLFCLKQLVEHRVLVKIGDIFTRGIRFDNYQKIIGK
jgi:hypothetical protein